MSKTYQFLMHSLFRSQHPKLSRCPSVSVGSSTEKAAFCLKLFVLLLWAQDTEMDGSVYAYVMSLWEKFIQGRGGAVG